MQTIRSLGLVRGLVSQIIGTLVGMGLVMAIRLLAGWPAWKPEPVIVVGYLIGAACNLVAVGVFTDWFRSLLGKEIPEHYGPPEGLPAWTRYFNWDSNHKIIAVQYSVTSLFLMVFAGSLALVFRMQLAQAGMHILDPDTYNTFMSAHGIIMIASILVGIGGMANFLVPLMIGARDMIFPRVNAMGYWVVVPGAVLVISGIVFGGWDTGWVGYPPLSAQDPIGVDLFFLGVFFIGWSSILGALNVIGTVLRLRAPGMTMFRMPIFVWGMFATALLQLTATQLIGLSFAMVVSQRLLGFGFFDPNLSQQAIALGSPPGRAILYQHLFWFYSHPAVYIFVLPGVGIISEILPVFARKPLFGYRAVALSAMAIALLSFLVWGHHMFAAGIEPFLRVPLMFSTLLIAVPTGVKFFSWVATIWEGRLTFPTPMLFVFGAISIFLLGGLSGPPLATVPTDLYLHDTYFVVGHFHATMFGGFIFPFFAALYFWFPKATGRMYNEKLGKLHFWLMTPSFWVQTLGQMLVGMQGMRRRIVTYDPGLGVGTTQLLITIAGFLIALSVGIMLYNLITSLMSRKVAETNPWRSRSPEWLLPSPVPEHNYPRPIVVVGEPYDYGLPGSVYVRMAPAGASK
jgi:cytochrome c oxidase subunit 1